MPAQTHMHAYTYAYTRTHGCMHMYTQILYVHYISPLQYKQNEKVAIKLKDFFLWYAFCHDIICDRTDTQKL